MGWTSIAVCLLMGSGGVYYAVFGGGLLTLASVFAFRRSTWKVDVAQFAVLVFALGGSFAINMAPSIFYFIGHGRDTAVAQRSFMEADAYSLKISALLMPIQDHRILSWARSRYAYLAVETPYVPQNDATVALGLAGGLGFLILIAYLFVSTSTGRRHSILAPLSILNLCAILLATMGGFGPLLAFYVSPQIRCYYRMSVYIALFSFAGLLVLVGWITGKRLLRMRPSVVSAVFAALLFAGLWDITPARGDNYISIRREFQSDCTFIKEIERSVPAGAMIFQLPYQPFPENGPVYKMLDYDHFRGYFHSDRLKWSYGAMKGRPEDMWVKETSRLPVSLMLARLRTFGFRGLYIDSNGYADGGLELERQLTPLLGQKRFESADGRFVYYSLDTGASAAKQGPRINVVAPRGNKADQ